MEYNKEVLQDLYWGQGLSLNQIANRFDTSAMNVLLRMARFGIPRRRGTILFASSRIDLMSASKKPSAKQRDWNHAETKTLEDYFALSTPKELSTLFSNRTFSAILNKAHRLNLRKNKWVSHQNNFVKLNPSIEFKQIFDGLMLSDGFLQILKNGWNACFSMKSKHQEFAVFTSELFRAEGFSGKTSKLYNDTGILYEFKSHVHPWLTEQRKRWYPNGFKHIPSDLVISPLVLKFEFVGDGSAFKRKNGMYGVHFATECFIKSEVVKLQQELNALGFPFKMYKHRNGFNLQYYRNTNGQIFDILHFFDFIGNCPVNCFQYKWQVSKIRKEMN